MKEMPDFLLGGPSVRDDPNRNSKRTMACLFAACTALLIVSTALGTMLYRQVMHTTDEELAVQPTQGTCILHPPYESDLPTDTNFHSSRIVTFKGAIQFYREDVKGTQRIRVLGQFSASAVEPVLHALHILHFSLRDKAHTSESSNLIWNPSNALHGCPPASNREAGNLGNILPNSDGFFIFDQVNDQLALKDIVGRTVILYSINDSCSASVDFVHDLNHVVGLCTIVIAEEGETGTKSTIAQGLSSSGPPEKSDKSLSSVLQATSPNADDQNAFDSNISPMQSATSPSFTYTFNQPQGFSASGSPMLPPPPLPLPSVTMPLEPASFHSPPNLVTMGNDDANVFTTALPVDRLM